MSGLWLTAKLKQLKFSCCKFLPLWQSHSLGYSGTSFGFRILSSDAALWRISSGVAFGMFHGFPGWPTTLVGGGGAERFACSDGVSTL